MHQLCPKCKKFTSDFLGVFKKDIDNCYLYKCEQHDATCYFYECKSCSINTIEKTTFIQYLEQIIKCPRSSHHKKQVKGHEHIFIRAKGKGNRYYCTQHPTNKRSIYDFYLTEYKQLSIKNLLDNILITDYNTKGYNTLLEYIEPIMREQITYNIEEDKDYLLFILFSIKLPQEHIARIFHTSQSKISSYTKSIKEQENFKHIANIRTYKKDPINRTLYYKVRLEKQMFENLNNNIPLIMSKKIITLSPYDLTTPRE